jgi:hypothetical protein
MKLTALHLKYLIYLLQKQLDEMGDINQTIVFRNTSGEIIPNSLVIEEMTNLINSLKEQLNALEKAPGNSYAELRIASTKESKTDSPMGPTIQAQALIDKQNLKRPTRPKRR